MNYKAYFDELNVTTENAVKGFNGKFNKSTDDDSKRRDLEEFLDFIEDALLSSIELGVNSANEDLKSKFDANYILDSDIRSQLIYEEIKGETWVERILTILDNTLTSGGTDIPVYDVQRIVETESHRIINNTKYLVGSTVSADTGREVYKKWVTVNDDRVRETHDFLEGAVVGLSEPFITIGGDSALYPGGFNDANNNINCRCVVELI